MEVMQLINQPDDDVHTVNGDGRNTEGNEEQYREE
jgi:hypothetical protein